MAASFFQEETSEKNLFQQEKVNRTRYIWKRVDGEYKLEMKKKKHELEDDDDESVYQEVNSFN